MPYGQRRIRGIRSGIPAGFVIARKDGAPSSGTPQLIAIKDKANNILGVPSKKQSSGVGTFVPLTYLDTDPTLAANSDVRIATQKATKAYADAVAAGGGIPMGYLDTDGTLAANSDVKVASQKATKTYVDAAAAAAPGTYTDEKAQDALAAAFAAGTQVGLTISYSDVGNSFSFTNLITQYTDEMAQDAAAALIQNGTGISWSYSDVGNTLTPTVTLAPFSTTNLGEGANLYYTDERVDDRVANLIQNGTGITWSYNDAGGTLTPTVTITQYTDELAQDAIAAAFAAGTQTGITVTYTDVSNKFDFTISDEYIQDLMNATLVGGTAISIVYNDGPGLLTVNVVPTTDGTLAANSDTLVPSQKAVKTYADTKRSEYAILSAFTGTLDAGLEDGVLTAMQELSDAGLLTKVKGLWAYCVPTQADALRNWINPGTSDLTISGTPTFTANEGFTGNGTDAQLVCPTSPAGLGAGLDDMAVGVYILTPSAAASTVIGQTDVTHLRRTFLNSTALGGTIGTRLNSATTSVTPTRYTGLFVLNRVGSAGYDAYLDDAKDNAIVQVSTSLCQSIGFLAIKDTTSSGFSTAKIAYSFISVGLTAADIAVLHQIMFKFMRSRPSVAIPLGASHRVQPKNLILPVNDCMIVADRYMLHADATLTILADATLRIL